MPELPKKYSQFWKPLKSKGTLYHLTTKQNLARIKQYGFLKPQDPNPKYWSGMKAVFMADPKDPLYKQTLNDVKDHVKSKHNDLIRLHIRTNNQLYKSLDPKRTFQVASLEPIKISDIVYIETVI